MPSPLAPAQVWAGARGDVSSGWLTSVRRKGTNDGERHSTWFALVLEVQGRDRPLAATALLGHHQDGGASACDRARAEGRATSPRPRGNAERFGAHVRRALPVVAGQPLPDDEPEEGEEPAHLSRLHEQPGQAAAH